MPVTPPSPYTLAIAPAGRLTGSAHLPPDADFGLCALAVAAQSLGETVIGGLPDMPVLASLATALTALGAGVRREGEGVWRVTGRGTGGLAEPDRVLDPGGSVAVAALLAGTVATHAFAATMGGSAAGGGGLPPSLPAALTRIGAKAVMRSTGDLPGVVQGTAFPLPAHHDVPPGQGWTGAALLLAGANIAGRTSVAESGTVEGPMPCLLRCFGAAVDSHGRDGGRVTSITGHAELTGCALSVPADAALAGPVLVAALLRSGSRLSLPGGGGPRLRRGLLPALERMGARIGGGRMEEERAEGLAADLSVQAGGLRGATLSADQVQAMAADLPALLVAAAFATGPTVLDGLDCLPAAIRHRLRLLEQALAMAGVGMMHTGGRLVIDGTGGPVRGGIDLSAHGDADLALTLSVFGVGCREGARVTQVPSCDRLAAALGALNAAGARIDTGTTG